jgi:hypothetical protein
MTAAAARINKALATALTVNAPDERARLIEDNRILRAQISRLESYIGRLEDMVVQSEEVIGQLRRGGAVTATPAGRGYRLMSQKDAAQHYGVNQSTISRRVAKGELKTQKVEGFKHPKVVVSL